MSVASVPGPPLSAMGLNPVERLDPPGTLLNEVLHTDRPSCEAAHFNREQHLKLCSTLLRHKQSFATKDPDAQLGCSSEFNLQKGQKWLHTF